MSAHAPKLLVVTPTLGRSPYLAETIASCTRFGVDTEHVVVAPAAAAGSIALAHPQVRVVAEQAEDGMYGAINRGVAHASQEWDWFTYLNDDDLLTIAEGEEVLACAAEPTILYGRCDAIDAQGAPLFPINVSRTGAAVADLLRWGVVPITQQGMILNRAAWSRLERFDQSFTHGADLELIVRAINAGITFRFERRIKGAFRVQRGQLSKQAEAMQRDYERALAKQQRGVRSSRSLLAFRFRGLPGLLRRVKRFGLRSTREIYATQG